MSTDVIVVSIFGLIFISAVLLLAIRFPNPTAFQFLVFRVVMSLAAGGVAAGIPGFLNFSTDVPGMTIRAGGALAVFILIYRLNPAKLVPIESINEGSGISKDLIIEILGNTYRRAFSLNFTTRMVNYQEYEKVLKSIQNCHSLLQQKMVRVVATYDSETVHLVNTMLRQLELMETVFRKMEPYALDPQGKFDKADESRKFLAGRVDGTGQPGLMQAFVDMEKVRINFLLNTTKLARKFDLTLPEVPLTEARPVFHGAMTNLEMPSVNDIEKNEKEIVSGFKFNIRPSDHLTEQVQMISNKEDAPAN